MMKPSPNLSNPFKKELLVFELQKSIVFRVNWEIFQIIAKVNAIQTGILFNELSACFTLFNTFLFAFRRCSIVELTEKLLQFYWS